MIFLLFSTLVSFAGTTNTYEIRGMTCNSCVKMITAKVCKLEGMDTCKVEIGKLTFSAKDGAQITPEALTTAIKSAGDYELVTPKK